MKTINNILANENPSGTGVVVSNNVLHIWDAEEEAPSVKPMWYYNMLKRRNI